MAEAAEHRKQAKSAEYLKRYENMTKGISQVAV